VALALRLGLERVGSMLSAVCGPLDEGPALRANGMADSVAHAALGDIHTMAFTP
jgi:hypothetical protein